MNQIMKRNILKRALAMALASALALQGGYTEARAAVIASEETVAGEEVFAIVNPISSEITAYAGQPLTFHVYAVGADRYAADGLEALAGATFEDGLFSWNPSEADLGKTYVLTLTASKGSGASAKTVEKTVTIEVQDKDYVLKTETITVSEDTYLKTYQSEKSQKCGNESILCVLNGYPGLLGEQQSDNNNQDNKLSMLKFDLSSLKGKAIVNADLSLTYISCNSGHNVSEQKLRAAVVSNEWSESVNENGLSWNKWIELSGNEEITEEQIVESQTYDMAHTNGGGGVDLGVRNNANYNLDGRKITTDITSFVEENKDKEADAEGHNYLSLAVNEATGGKQHYFVSKEGVAFFKAISERKIEHAAPTLFVTYKEKRSEDDFRLEWADRMFLKEGYDATGSDSYMVLGTSEAYNLSGIKLSGNTGGGRITLDTEKQRLDIAKGLTAGAYKVNLEIPLKTPENLTPASPTPTSPTSPEDIYDEDPITGQGPDGALIYHFTLYVDERIALPEFTGPRDSMQAYVGTPLSFHARVANRMDFGDRITIDLKETDIPEDDYTYDQETGEFKWTPKAENNDALYYVTFTARGRNQIPVDYRVAIRVGKVQEGIEVATVPVVADGHIQTWKTDVDKGNAKRIVLRTQRVGADTGLLGEVVGKEGVDSKVIFLKFDLHDLEEFLKDEESYTKAELALTYVCRSRGSGAATVELQADMVSYTDWTEEAVPADQQLTANNWQQWAFAFGDDYRAEEKNLMRSEPYAVKTPVNAPGGDPDQIGASFNQIDGKKIKIDITDRLRRLYEEYTKNPNVANDGLFTMIVCSARTGSNEEQIFVSREGAAEGGFQNKTALNGQEIMAPSIVLTKMEKETVLNGPRSLTLIEGYDETKSDSFAVQNASSENVITTFPAQYKDLFAWDKKTRQIIIKPGLPVATGSASYSPTVHDRANNATATMRLEVVKNMFQELKTAYQAFVPVKEQGAYSCASWAKYQYEIERLKALLSTGLVLEEQNEEAQKTLAALQNGTLKTLPEELAAQIEKYSSKPQVYEKVYYTEATYAGYESAINALKALTGTKFTEAELGEKVSVVREAIEKLEFDVGNPVGRLLGLIQQAREEIAKNIYTSATMAALVTAKDEAERAFAAMTDASDPAIAEAAGKLEDALGSLVKVPAADLVDRIAEAIKDLPDTNTKYTMASWNAYQIKLAAANHLLSEDDLTQEDVDAAILELTEAVKGLLELTKVLETEIAKYENPEGGEAGYTAISWSAYQEKLAEANGLKDTEFTESDINKKIAALKRAYEALVKLSDVLKTEIAKYLKPDSDKDKYPEEAWNAYKEKLAAANALKGTTYTESEMRQAIEELKTAYEALVDIPVTPENPEMEKLNDLIETVEGLNESDYTVDSWSWLMECLDTANDVAEKGDAATEDEIQRAYAMLKAAYDALDSKTSEAVTKADLEALISVVNGLKLSDYPLEIQSKITAALRDAQSAIAKGDALTNEELKIAYDALKKAYEGRGEPNPGGNTPGGNTPGGNTPGGNGTPNTPAATLAANETAQLDGMSYQVVNPTEKTVILTKGKDQATVSIPATINVKGFDCKVIGIGKNAFAKYKSLKKVTISDTVTDIGSGAFTGCKKLTSVIIGQGVTTIGKKAFSGCKKLKSVTIKGSAIKSIQASAFKATNSKVKVKLPKKMKAAQKKKLKNMLIKKGKISKKAVIK